MRTDEKYADEKNASPSQRSAVIRAGPITRRHDTRPASKKCIVHAKKIATTTNVRRACPAAPGRSPRGVSADPSAARRLDPGSAIANKRGVEPLSSPCPAGGDSL